MLNSINKFTNTWLEPVQTDCASIIKLLEKSHDSSTDFSELYLQYQHSDSWSLEESKVKSSSSSVSAGAGARVVAGEKTGFCHTSSFALSSLNEALNSAALIKNYSKGSCKSTKLECNTKIAPIYTADSPLKSVQESEIVSILQEMDAFTRSIDSKIDFVELTVSRKYEHILVISSDGVLASDIRPLFRCGARVIVKNGDRRESGYSGAGGRIQLDTLGIKEKLEISIHQAVNEALINLDARPATAGTMPVVLGAGWPGILLHEAVGHGLEADFNRKGTSIFSGRIGEQVASKGCTVVDNGTMLDRRGSVQIDDEGTPGAENILIENGILKGYMQDKLNAGLMGAKLTGNGRRESYAHLPMPRMTNTYMLAGDNSTDEMIESVDDGIYAVNFGGGQVDITSGNFVFNASLAYRIEKGKITYPIKGVSLIGNGPESMQCISMIGNKLEFDPGIGVCGKEGQSVPVGVGQPSLKMDNLVVGGSG